MQRLLAVVFASLLVLTTACSSTRPDVWRITPREDARGPRVLGVIAHPDDETAFAATLYAITIELDGVCDLAVITNGEGGFKYSTLAERLYEAELTDEAVGRAQLPAIRRFELCQSAWLLGVHELLFFDERDHRYTLDVSEVLAPGATVWDLEDVRRRLRERLDEWRYDFVFVLMPTADTHAHHKAAAILALEVVATMPADERPVVLAARTVEANDTSTPETLPEYQLTRLDSSTERWVFDRTRKFGHEDKLDYRIVVNWAIAAHKSQGTMQLYVNQGEHEQFWSFAQNSPGARARAAELFERLRGARATEPAH